MAPLPIYFDVGGHWNKLETCWVWCEAQSEMKGIMLEEESPDLSMLINKICTKAGIESENKTLKITYLLPKQSDKMKPIGIYDDEDLVVFMGLVEFNGCTIPLHVQVQEEEDMNSVGCDIAVREEIVLAPTNEEEIQRISLDDEIFVDVALDANVSAPNDMGLLPSPQPLMILNEREVGSSSALNSFTFNDGSNLQVGDHFRSKRELRTKLHVIALKGRFEFLTKKLNKNLLTVECVDPNCKWRVWACKLSLSNMFIIRKYCGIHSCLLEKCLSKHRQASYSVIEECIISQFVGIPQGPRPKSIRHYVRSEFGTDFSYYKGWMARQHAINLIRGTAKESFAILPSYCHTLKSVNADTVTHIKVDNSNRFQYLFVAHGPCIRGFVCMRKVIVVDGTFLKEKFRGVLLVATAQDNEHCCYPIAWGIVDKEDDASWTWFFSKLKEVVKDCEHLVFISDRHRSIKKAVETVYEAARHGCCTFHMAQNIKATFHSSSVLPLFFKAAYAYRIDEFDMFFKDLCFDYPRVGIYLQEQVGFENWSRAHFKGNRYDIMTSNLSESLNGMLEDVRDYPVVALLDYVLGKMFTWFNERWTNAVVTTTVLTPINEKILHNRYDKAGFLSVNRLNIDEYYVVGGEVCATVNIRLRTCSCRVFDVDQMPCEYAIAACEKTETSVYELCSHYYKTDTFVNVYAETIYPLPDLSQWDILDVVRKMRILSPIVERRRGRSKHKRFTSTGESMKQRRNGCARCGQYGHYQKTCTNATIS